MEEMVAAEPSLVAPILASAEPARRIAELIRAAVRDRAPVVVTGCGTSETAAMAIVDLVQEALKSRGKGLVHARQALEASEDPWPGFCLGISHEGSTRATILALEAARRVGATTALITARAQRAGTAAADAVLVTPLIDRSWCHTVGYLSPILAGAAIADAVAGSRTDASGLEAALGETATLAAGIDAVARTLFGVDRLITTGAGPDRSPARELALKIEEGVWVPARMLELETILHGHLAACDERTGLVLVSTGAESRFLVRASMVIRAARRIGIRVGAIVSRAADRALADVDVERAVLPGNLERYGLIGRFSGAALALQRLTLALSRLAGTNPDLIRRQQEPYREAARMADSSATW
jgi:glutamine---fructose-6-phosphate transaminase (isomerizing)